MIGNRNRRPREAGVRTSRCRRPAPSLVNRPDRPAHVVVLAAGRGSRLGALGGATPKWLLRVGGRTLADRQLEGVALAATLSAVASIRVVVGHAAEAIEAALAGRPEDVTIVTNPEFAEINNWWSLLRAVRELPDEEPVVVLNADLLADPQAIAAFVAEAAYGPAEGLLAVDLERRLTEESMKVSRASDGALARIGKAGVATPVGEYVGMLAARGGTLRRLRDELESFVGRAEHVDQWYEAAVGFTAAAGVAWHVWPMPSGGWVEIDDDGDLEAAEALVGTP
jgi:choline kinase